MLTNGILHGVQVYTCSPTYMWVSRFKYGIKVAPAKFELGVTSNSCPAHVEEHLNQLWDSNKSPLSI